MLLDPARTSRLTYQKDFDRGLPSLLGMLTRVTARVWLSEVPSDSYQAELQRLVQQVWTDQLLAAASSNVHSSAARSRITFHLRDLHVWLDEHADERGDETRAHRFSILDELDRYLFRPYQPQETSRPLVAPPGSPIGSAPAWLIRSNEREAWLKAWEEATTICAVGDDF